TRERPPGPRAAPDRSPRPRRLGGLPMTDPFDDPTGRWGLIFHGSGMYRRSHPRQEWAQISDAIRTADLLRAGTTRGDAAWCHLAADTYTRLHDAGAYAHLRPGDQPLRAAQQHL